MKKKQLRDFSFVIRIFLARKFVEVLQKYLFVYSLLVMYRKTWPHNYSEIGDNLWENLSQIVEEVHN